MKQSAPDLTITAELGRDGADLHPVDFGIEAASFFTVVPTALVAELKLPAMMLTSVAFRGQELTGVRIGSAYLRLMEREGVIPFCVIDLPQPLLGKTALEALGLGLNPQDNVLEYVAAHGFGTLLLDEEDF